MIHRLSTACGFFVCVGMRATFFFYDHIIKVPENLELWENFSIYEGLDKIPEICYTICLNY
jgi:hypothetical protein